MVDAIFAERRLAEVYDPLDPDRGDLDAYVAMVEEFGVRSVLDIGCGTGTFACLLARRGLTVTAVDPAAASLHIAQTKRGADQVCWVHGYVTDLPPVQVDLVTMTGNVAQVFVTDAEWAAALRAAHAALRPGGRLVFETRDPAAKAWLEWNRERSYRRTVVPGVGAVQAWEDLLDVSGDQVSFRSTFVFEADGAVLTSRSTLRFRHQDEVTASLAAAGFVVDEVRQAPDRPGRELVFIARRGRRRNPTPDGGVAPALAAPPDKRPGAHRVAGGGHTGTMDDAVRDYIDAIPPEHRQLFDRLHRLVLETHPEAAVVLSYQMPTYKVGRNRLFLGVWRHGVSIYGWRHGHDAGFTARHPELRSSKGTIQLRPETAAAIPDDELRDLMRAALDDPDREGGSGPPVLG